MKLEYKYNLIIILGFIFMLGPIAIQASIDIQMSNKQTNFVVDSYGNRLFTTYYPGTDQIYDTGEYGIMLFHGMGNDQKSLDIFTTKFRGAHIFCTDFSGHGRSSGVIPSGNNSDLKLADQVLQAKAKFKELSGLNDSQIFILGHSMGARALMKAVTIDTALVRGCILLGAAIDVDTASNSSWVNDLNPINPDTNILIISGTLEDVCPPEQALNLYLKLSNDTSLTETHEHEIFETPSGLIKELRIFKALTHTHEASSFRCAEFTKRWISEILTSEHPLNPTFDYSRFEDYRVYYSIIELVGIFLLLIYGQKYIKYKQVESITQISEKQEPTATFKLTNFKKYALYKTLIWLGGFGFAFLLGLLIILLPIGIPFFTLIFVCPIAGYGIISIILYGAGKMPGFEGKWKPRVANYFKTINWINLIFAVSCFIIIATVLAYLINSFLYHVFPLNKRLVWLLAFTIFSSLGFYILQLETEAIQEASVNKVKYTIINNILFLFPFLVGIIMIFAMGWIIYLPDAIHDVIIIGIVILTGNLLQQIWKKSLFTAIAQAFLLFFLLLPRGQFAIFF
ncbi:MAG: alpha/beta fold hydrolase [Candidatus Heimdallarchaeota archaeon]|nr:alpha/beta fold hydrolase [Candidatus Heimdallarchaeota archaeon]